MAYYMITYDLVGDEHAEDYDRITDALKELGAVRPQRSTWLLAHGATQSAIYNHLVQYVDQDDRLMVIEFHTRPSWNRAFKATNEWIAEHFG